MWRLFVTVSFVIIVAAGSGFAVRAGWIPWTYPVVGFMLACVLGGLAIRRRRGTQPPLAIRRKPVAIKDSDLIHEGEADHARQVRR